MHQSQSSVTQHVHNNVNYTFRQAFEQLNKNLLIIKITALLSKSLVDPNAHPKRIDGETPGTCTGAKHLANTVCFV